MLVADKLPLGGAEMVVYNLTLNLNPATFKTYVCCLEGLGEIGEKLKENGIDVIDLGSRKGIDLFLPFKLASIFKRFNIQIVHAHNSTSFKHAALAAKIASVPIVVQTRHGYELRPKKIQERLFLDLASRQADAIVCICRDLKRTINKNERIQEEKLTVIPNGIDTEKFADFSANLRDKKEELGVEDDQFILINVANILPEKDQITLLRAFKILKDNKHKVKLFIAGRIQNKDTYEGIKDLVSQLNIAEDVVFLGERKDIPELLYITDIFILSSVLEGMPLAILEAMAAGKPIVATDVGGISEIVAHNETGLLVPPKSPETLANAISILLRDKNKRYQLGANARVTAKERFSLRAMVDNYEELYWRLISRKIPNKNVRDLRSF